MKKPVISGWVLSFGSEKALLQAVRVLVKEEICAGRFALLTPAPLFVLPTGTPGRPWEQASGCGPQRAASAGFWPWLCGFTGRSSVRIPL